MPKLINLSIKGEDLYKSFGKPIGFLKAGIKKAKPKIKKIIKSAVEKVGK